MRQRRSLAFTGTRPQEKECASKPQTVRIRSTIRETTAQQHFDRFGRKRAPAKPALVEVNGLSDFNVRIEPIRHGGVVRGPLTEFWLTWERKTSDEWRGVLDELMRRKVGRRARITGTVEKIS